MTFTKYQFNNFCYWPSNTKKIVEFIGGSFLASKPDLTYKRFIESLINKNYAVHAYKYTPQFDHQQHAIKAWKDFKNCRISLSKRIGKSIPLLKQISQKLEFNSEFSPSPQRTLRLIEKTYSQKNNFLIKFNQDELDQTDKLFSCLKARKEDNSKGVMLKGTHTIIASAGLRENFLGDWADDEFKRNTIKKISNLIDESD